MPEQGAFNERRHERAAPQYAQAYQYQQQYQQFPQPQNPQGGQPRGGSYSPDGAPGNGRGAEYPARSPQYSQEEAERAERERQAERRALLRRQINEARDLYAPVRKP